MEPVHCRALEDALEIRAWARVAADGANRKVLFYDRPKVHRARVIPEESCHVAVSPVACHGVALEARAGVERRVPAAARVWPLVCGQVEGTFAKPRDRRRWQARGSHCALQSGVNTQHCKCCTLQLESGTTWQPAVAERHATMSPSATGLASGEVRPFPFRREARGLTIIRRTRGACRSCRRCRGCRSRKTKTE